MKRAPDPVRAEAYRLSLEGFGSSRRQTSAGAESLLARSVALDPKDGVARYRYGRVLQAKKEDAAALAAVRGGDPRARATARRPSSPPPTSKRRACTSASRATTQAIDYYRAASTLFGGGADTRAAATRALVRLRAAK